ncbi:hypothetical protein WICPIJ_007685 [Wickerhamomyces pijperi]|uniref:Uncharacterized protein n=1 Tax=Wickerhamomyces pijperi TaxID=599730 RepID=A0A9P8PZ98_WICPI|nr:hypothetical protein WICPIJ_007685 [Wickerhamomyces pijperi]
MQLRSFGVHRGVKQWIRLVLHGVCMIYFEHGVVNLMDLIEPFSDDNAVHLIVNSQGEDPTQDLHDPEPRNTVRAVTPNVQTLFKAMVEVQVNIITVQRHRDLAVTEHQN